MPACRRWHNACSLVLKPGLDENGLTCVIYDLIDGPYTGGMNADDAVCNLKRSNPCCGRSYRSNRHERALLNDERNKAINNNAKKITCRTARPGLKILGGCSAGTRTPAAPNRASMSMADITRAVPNILFNMYLPFTAIHTAG